MKVDKKYSICKKVEKPFIKNFTEEKYYIKIIKPQNSDRMSIHLEGLASNDAEKVESSITEIIRL